MNRRPSLSLYGLIGYPVKHSLSPAMHNAAFKASAINAEYRLFEILPKDLEDFLLNADKKIEDIDGNIVRAGDIKGFNITVPHKVKAKEILITGDVEQLQKEMQQHDKLDIQPDQLYKIVSGAINTVNRDSGECYNTDVRGFLESLEKDLGFFHQTKNILLIGCGGAGRAVVAGLSYPPNRRIYIYEMNQSAANSAQEQFSKFGFAKSTIQFITQDQIEKVIKECQLLVNASPVGMKEGDVSLIGKNLLHKDLFVYDVVYNRETQLVKDAKSLGLPAAGGLGMLLYQGVAAWELWMEREAPVSVMKQALDKEIK